MSHAETISRNKARLLLTQLFFGGLACSLDFVEQPDLNPPTMATDGEKVYYHPDFVASHDDDELMFVICHEIMHVALVHMFRLRGLDPYLANVAADIAINYILVEEKVGKMPKCGLYNADLYKRGDGTMEGIYAILVQAKQKGKLPEELGKCGGQKRPGKSGGKPGQGQPGQGGAPGDGEPELMDALKEPAAGKTEAERNMIEAEVRMKVEGALTAAQVAGKLPGSLKRLIGEALTVHTPWQHLLRRFFDERSDDYRSWARPNRRFAAQGIYLPGPTGVRMGTVCVGSDASGSIGQHMFDVFGAEINKVIEDTKPKRVLVGVFDTRITEEIDHNPQEGDRLHLKARAGGGTNFAPVMDWCVEQENSACLIMLTDGHCSSFGIDPGVPVLWAVLDGNRKFDPPFGEVIHIAAPAA